MKERPILFNGAMVRALLDGSKTQTRRLAKDIPYGPDCAHFEVEIMDWPLSGVYQDRTNTSLDHWWLDLQCDVDDCSHSEIKCPFGQVGDQLWVRETWRTDDSLNDKAPSMFSKWPVKYEADGKRLAHGAFHGNTKGKTRASMHMPRWASRIQLEITGVRVERLQDISEEDAKAEGVMQLDADGFERPIGRNKDGWKLCPVCAGTGLHSTLGANGGVNCDVDCVHCDTHEKLFKHLWNSTGGNWEDNPWVWVIEFKRAAA